VSDDLLALDGVAHLEHGDFEWSEVGFISVDLGEFRASLLVVMTTRLGVFFR